MKCKLKKISKEKKTKTKTQLSQEKLSWTERPEQLLSFGAASIGKNGRTV